MPEYMNTYILTESRNFKILSKENYAIALDSSYLCTKKMLNMELIFDSAYAVRTH